MSVGRKIELARREKGWTQEELAKKINSSRPTINHWERGHTKPNTDDLLKISNATGKPTSYFLEDKNFNEPLTVKALSRPYKHPKMSIGEKIRLARREKNWSQKKLAKKVNVSLQTINNWENKHFKTNTDALQKIAQATNKPISYFMEDKNKICPTPEIEQALQDPVAVKALLTTYKHPKDVKDTIEAFLETVPSLSPEKRKAILTLCKN